MVHMFGQGNVILSCRFWNKSFKLAFKLRYDEMEVPLRVYIFKEILDGFMLVSSHSYVNCCTFKVWVQKSIPIIMDVPTLERLIMCKPSNTICWLSQRSSDCPCTTASSSNTSTGLLIKKIAFRTCGLDKYRIRFLGLWWWYNRKLPSRTQTSVKFENIFRENTACQHTMFKKCKPRQQTTRCDNADDVVWKHACKADWHPFPWENLLKETDQRNTTVIGSVINITALPCGLFRFVIHGEFWWSISQVNASITQRLHVLQLRRKD